MQTPKSYQNTDIETADRGRLILMIYDHCIKWCKVAQESINNGKIEQRVKAIFKVQDGLTELQCSLDFEKGGEIAKNLFNLYDFYGRHLMEGNMKNSAKHIAEVQQMMETLRGAWGECIQNVRKSRELDMRMNNRSYISMVG
jgi:flagellar protein FliS